MKNGICYEFIDPRNHEVFYVGIGENESRMLEPERNEAVNARIEEIHASGHKEVRRVVFSIPMDQCLIWETREISIRKLAKDGGTLLNISKGTSKCAPKYKQTLNVSEEILSKAAAGRRLIEEAISDLLASNPSGVCNADVSKTLSLEFPGKDGRHKGYVTYSILHAWVRDGKVRKTQNKLFFKN